MRRVGAALFVSIAIAVTFRAGLPLAVAHTTLREAIHHQTELKIGDRNVDVTVELEFHEDASLPERREMDADNDGEITEPETAAYLEAHAEEFEKAIEVKFADRALKLVPLYEAKLDLLGKDATGSHGHILRLFYFARLPHPPEPGDAFRFSERLWPKVEALRTLEVTAGEGQRWEAHSTNNPAVWQVQYVRKTKEQVGAASSDVGWGLPHAVILDRAFSANGERGAVTQGVGRLGSLCPGLISNGLSGLKSRKMCKLGWWRINKG